MTQNESTRIVGYAFVASAVLLWVGWMVLPVKIGTFFQTGDFAAVHEQFHLWIWMFRFYLFGIVIAVMALVALGSVLTESPARVGVWPGVAMAVVGLMVGACAHAFYYHFGALGALELHGKPSEAIAAFVASLEVMTEYVTCLTRFGRVFGGFGMLVLGCGLLKWKVLPNFVGGVAVVIGLAAMALTLGLPDDLHLYLPIFHLHALWIATVGIVTLRSGIRTGA